MPWRISGSESTSKVVYGTLIELKTCTTAFEKPHCGISLLPFMKTMILFSFTIAPMRSLASPAPACDRSMRARLEATRLAASRFGAAGWNAEHTAACASTSIRALREKVIAILSLLPEPHFKTISMILRSALSVQS